MGILILLFAISSVGAVTNVEEQFRLYTEKLIDRINNEPGITWKAGPTPMFRTFDDMKLRLGARREHPVDKQRRRPTRSYNVSINGLPTEFDARDKWWRCPTIGQIRDQSSCGSCWAFGAVEAMSDRLCIHSNEWIKVQLSATDLLSCCQNCGNGCRGGWPGLAWDYWKNRGIVTGGSKENAVGCQPYPFPSCTHHGNGTRAKCRKELYDTPKCHRICVEGYEKPYSMDRYFASSSYNVHPNEDDIKMEIMTNGPVEAAFDVYEDFSVYTGGVYQHNGKDEPISGHAVRILGWGVDKETYTPYWLAANSWNEEWGEKGYFRILRGKNNCGIESEIVAGMPFP